jgi:hypothetical protein
MTDKELKKKGKHKGLLKVAVQGPEGRTPNSFILSFTHWTSLIALITVSSFKWYVPFISVPLKFSWIYKITIFNLMTGYAILTISYNKLPSTAIRFFKVLQYHSNFGSATSGATITTILAQKSSQWSYRLRLWRKAPKGMSYASYNLKIWFW